MNVLGVHKDVRGPRWHFGPAIYAEAELLQQVPPPRGPGVSPGPTSGVARSWCAFWVATAALYKEMVSVIHQRSVGTSRRRALPAGAVANRGGAAKNRIADAAALCLPGGADSLVGSTHEHGTHPARSSTRNMGLT